MRGKDNTEKEKNIQDLGKDRRFTVKISFIKFSSRSDYTEKEKNKRRARTRLIVQVLSNCKMKGEKKKPKFSYKEISMSRAVNMVASGDLGTPSR